MESLHSNPASSNGPATPERKKSFRKLLFLYSLINLGILAVIIKIFIIQVVDVDKYKELARRQNESRVKLRPERGNIYDRNGLLIASTLKSYSFAADPTILTDKKEREKICKVLSRIAGIPKEKLLEKLKNARGSFVWLARGITYGIDPQLDSLKIHGFIKMEEPRRNFLFGSVGAQAVGCTDIDNKGITGVELGWDSVLCGKTGYTIMLRDAVGRLMPLASAPPVPAENGKSLQLTIDIGLQRIVEYELKLGVEKASAASGTVVAIDPSSGEILAMASYPSFNPNNMSENTEGSMRNRALTDVYEPGSTFKLITAAAALEENIITPGTLVDGHNGIMEFTDFVIRDDHPVGTVTFAEALAKSSNIVFSNTASSLSGNKYYKYIRDFGFGLSLGIDIPGEVPGKIRRASEMDATSKRFIGFGYGLAATPLQILNAYASVANKGVMLKPHIVKKAFDSDGELVYEAKPERIRKVISEKTAGMLVDMLCGVVDNGTGNSAKIKGVRVAGKTGTAQQLVDGSYKTKNYTASFVGFLPADNPGIAIIVVLDKPVGDYYGGSTAAPLFRNIAQRWLLIYHDLMDDKPVNYGVINEKIIVPDVVGLLAGDAKRILRSFGFSALNDIESSSVVTAQDPAPGINAAQGTHVRLTGVVKKMPDNKMASAQRSTRPDVRGLTLRRAINLLQQAGINPKVSGSGKVVTQTWMTGTNGKQDCLLICR